MLAQTIVNGGSYGKATRILSPKSVDALLHNENEEFPGNSHGLGFELNQMFYMDAPVVADDRGHTGYTGTSIVIDRRVASFVILLTNRVHPSRNWGSNNPPGGRSPATWRWPSRCKPQQGRTAWFSGVGDARTATLTVPVQLGAAPSRLTLRPLVRHRADRRRRRSSRRRTAAAAGRSWRTGPAGPASSGARRRWTWPALTGDVALRWRYTSDALYQGRGVYVDGIRVDVAGPHRLRRLPSAGRRCGAACGLVGAKT